MDAVIERDHFRYLTFTYDLLSFSMNEFDLPWSKPRWEEMKDYRSNKRFLPQVGYAILEYQRRHRRNLVEELNNLGAYGTMRDILLTIASATFQGENYVKEYFKFCAQIVTIGVDFMERGQNWQLELIVAQIDGVYDIFLKKRFMTLGGWNLLQKYAVRYCIYGE